LASQIEEAFNSGEVKKKLEDAAKQQEKGETGREKEAKVWEQSLQEMVKAGATAQDARYKAIQLTESIKNKLFWIAEKFPLYFMAIAAAGGVGSLLKGGLGGLGGLIGRGGGLGALLGGGIGIGGTLLGIGSAAAGGYAIGTAADWLAGKIVMELGGDELRRVVGEDTSLSGIRAVNLAYDEELLSKITRMRENEYKTLKEKVKLNEKIVKDLEARQEQLSYADKRKLEATKKETEAIKANADYQHRKRLEEEGTKTAVAATSRAQQADLAMALMNTQVKGKSLNQILDEVWKRGGSRVYEQKGGTEALRQLTSPEYKKDFTVSRTDWLDAEKFRSELGPEKLRSFQAQFAQDIFSARQELGAKEELSAYIAKTAAPLPMASIPLQFQKQFVAANQANLKLSVESEEPGQTAIESNVRGQMRVPLGKQYVVIDGFDMANKLAQLQNKQSKEK
jgi:hypothetical protein